MVETVGRVFAAVPIPTEIRMALADRIQALAIPGRLVPPKNWHVTLRFVGWIEAVTYDRFLHELNKVSELAPFRLRLRGIGAFPRASRATVVWVGIADGIDSLLSLNEIAEDAARAAGLEPEERPYHAHLTLSRVRPPEDVSTLLDAEIDLSFIARDVIVYESMLGRGGAKYEPLEALPLSG